LSNAIAMNNTIKRQLRAMVYGIAGTGYMETIETGTDCLLTGISDHRGFQAMTLAGLIYVKADDLEKKVRETR
jgi:hypothetical protein